MCTQYREPIIRHRADPYIYRHTDGYCYFTATVSAYDRIEVRRAKTIKGLKDAKPKTVWEKHSEGNPLEDTNRHTHVKAFNWMGMVCRFWVDLSRESDWGLR